MNVTRCLYCGDGKLTKVTHRSDNVNILRCSSCKVMMVDRISDNTESLYTADYFEKDSDTKSGYTDYLSSPAVNVLGKFGLCKQFISKEGSHLDLGSADGKLMEIFAANKYETTGLEISQAAVDIAKSKGLNAIQSNLHKFPKNLGKFDIITAFDLLEHADQPGLVLEQAWQHLDKDGYFVFSTLAVTQENPEDYWFNHSLEHYVYYDDVSLNNILTEKFGRDGYAFTRVDVHGISEFWGVAKKGTLKDEKAIVENISKDNFNNSDQSRSYYLTLFYNQLSKFTTSQKIIKNMSHKWSPQTQLMAKFYNVFYQGKYEEALTLVRESKVHIGLSNALYWQALSYINAQYLDIKQQESSRTLDLTTKRLEDKVFAYKLIAEVNIEKVRNSSLARRPVYRKALSKVKRTAKSKLRFDNNDKYRQVLPSPHVARRPNILITMPWMTFGGAETLVYNYCREIKDYFNISFITGLESANGWEYKFREVSDSIYHLPSLIDDPANYLDFISGYIQNAQIDVLHLIHNGFMFEMLPELKRRHPGIKVILTLFNDRVPQYVEGAIEYQPFIDKYVSDNEAVAESIKSKIAIDIDFRIIPNGINAYEEFNPNLFNKDSQRKKLSVEADELVVFFVGRLSPEKNPDVFIEVAKKCLDKGAKANFFLIGDGPMGEDVKKHIKDYGSDKISWLGYQEDVAEYLSAADVFVLPSSIEGFPLSILEAMSMGVVVIASNVGAVSEIINSGKDGFVVEPGSVEEISTEIQSLASDKIQMESIKKLARRKVKRKYSNKILKENYIRLYMDATK